MEIGERLTFVIEMQSDQSVFYFKHKEENATQMHFVGGGPRVAIYRQPGIPMPKFNIWVMNALQDNLVRV